MWYAYLIVEPVCNIPGLKYEHKPHGISDGAGPTDSLFTGHSDVDEDPKDQSGPKLIEGLDVEGSDGGI